MRAPKKLVYVWQFRASYLLACRLGRICKKNLKSFLFIFVGMIARALVRSGHLKGLPELMTVRSYEASSSCTRYQITSRSVQPMLTMNMFDEASRLLFELLRTWHRYRVHCWTPPALYFSSKIFAASLFAPPPPRSLSAPIGTTVGTTIWLLMGFNLTMELQGWFGAQACVLCFSVLIICLIGNVFVSPGQTMVPMVPTFPVPMAPVQTSANSKTDGKLRPKNRPGRSTVSPLRTSPMRELAASDPFFANLMWTAGLYALWPYITSIVLVLGCLWITHIVLSKSVGVRLRAILQWITPPIVHIFTTSLVPLVSSLCPPPIQRCFRALWHGDWAWKVILHQWSNLIVTAFLLLLVVVLGLGLLRLVVVHFSYEGQYLIALSQESWTSKVVENDRLWNWVEGIVGNQVRRSSRPMLAFQPL